MKTVCGACGTELARKRPAPGGDPMFEEHVCVTTTEAPILAATAGTCTTQPVNPARISSEPNKEEAPF